MLPTLAAGTATTASFKMEYAPFGLGGGAWTAGVNGGVKPVWVIRNGLNDVAQDADTDFAHYGLGGTANANGAISVAVVNPAASLGAGLYEDGNPWPIATAMTGASANDLATALTYLNTNGAAAKYGAYTIRLGVDPTLPVYPGEKITLGDGGGGDWEHPAITNTTLIIEGTTPVAVPGPELLWALNNGDSVRYGSGAVPPIVITPSAGILDSTFTVRTADYAVAVPSNVNEVTFTALVLDASAAVSYDAGTGYAETPPEATFSGLSGSVTFSVKVTSPTVEHVWGPYTFDVSRAMAYTIGGGLVYDFFDGADYEGLRFTGGTGTFTAIDFAAPDIDLLVVGGGGSGGGYVSPGGGGGTNDGGGGGAGGLVYKTGFTVQASDYTVSVGSGGGGVPYNTNGKPGGLSTFYLNSAGEPGNGISDSGAKAPGGGYGGYASGGSGGAGGSGGGGGRHNGGGGYGVANGGATVTGHDGAAGDTDKGGGGGGGAGGPGEQGPAGNGTGYDTKARGGLGGPGITLDITGTPYTYAKGGTGGSPQSKGGVNYGDGGGGGNYTGGGAAHSGIVVIRWEK
jgi:hypothetical protein